MLDFIRKEDVWRAIDAGRLGDLDAKISYQLKIAQDIAVYDRIADLTDLDVAEIGGGDSRILRQLAKNNACVNIEKFEGEAVGPDKEIHIDGVSNVHAFIGDFSPRIPDQSFDVIFSISVVEHVPTENLSDFFADSLRILRPGGQFIHAIDLYLSDAPSDYWRERYEIYQKWAFHEALIEDRQGADLSLAFTTDMISNPDNILLGWREFAPTLHELRKTAQNVSLLVSGQKRD